jgi:integrase
VAKNRRRGRSQGSLFYDKHAGRWAAVVTTYDPDTGKRHRVKQTDPGKDRAAGLLEAMLKERRETGTVAAKDYTVGHAIADLLKYQPASWKSPRTREVNQLHAARLTAALGKVPLARLTSGQIERHLLAEVTRARHPLSASTVRDELGLLRAAIRRAQRDELVTRNVAALARVPAGASRRVSKAMTVDQVSQLLSSDLSAFWRAWLTIALMLGLRPGEIDALAWEDIGDDGVLKVRHSLHARNGELVRGPLKTESSKRSLAMPQAVTEALAAWRAEQLTQQLAAGPAWQGSGLVFTDGYGHAMNRQKIHHGFRAAVRAAGIEGSWQPRELRHTFVSVMSAAGTDIEVVSDLVGHSNSHITRTVYAHAIADKISAAAQVMDSIYGAGAGTA